MLLAVLTYFVVYSASDVAATNCTDCIKGHNGTCYSVEFLQTLGANFRARVVINKMSILRADNTLFYSYEPTIPDPEYYKVAYVNLDQPDNNGTVFDPNNPVHNFGTFDIDQTNSIVYLGGRDGIYTYKNGKIAWNSSLGDEIKTVFFKDRVIMIKSNESTIVEKIGDYFKSAINEGANLTEAGAVKNFVKTKDNVIVYLGTKGLFLIRGLMVKQLSGNSFFRGLAIDLQGKVFTWWIDEISMIDIKENLNESRLVPVININNLVSLTFDNSNNMLFTVGKSLHRLTLQDNSTEC